MTDMTAEQALQVCMERLERDIESAKHRGDNREAEYEARILEGLRQALTAPRVPDGWVIEPYGESEFVIKSPAARGGWKIVTRTQGDYAPGTRTLVALCRALLTAAPAPANDTSDEYADFIATEGHQLCGDLLDAMVDSVTTAPANITLETDLSKMVGDYPGAVDWTGLPAPAPDDSFAENYDVIGDGVAVLKPEAARRMIGLDKAPEYPAQDELAKLRERVKVLEVALIEYYLADIAGCPSF